MCFIAAFASYLYFRFIRNLIVSFFIGKIESRGTDIAIDFSG